MYTTGLSYRYHQAPNSWDGDGVTTSNSSTRPDAPLRRNRYSRSSTTSVAQLLTESCSTLLQKLTTKVRGPSEAATATTPTPKRTSGFNPLSTSKSSTTIANFGTTRSRLEDKYSSVLEKIYGRKREQPEPLTKSATTSNVLLAEKSYPYVTTREKTPYRIYAR